MANRTGWRGLRRAAWALTFGLLSCSVGTEPTPAPSSAPVVALREWTTPPALGDGSRLPTAALVADPMNRTAIDHLAALSARPEWVNPIGLLGPWYRVDARQTGIDGRESDAWRTSDALSLTLSSAEATALLRHEAPSVRVYAARDLLHDEPIDDALEALYPLYADDQIVEVVSGCTGEIEPVGQAVVFDVMTTHRLVDREKDDYLTMLVNDSRLPAAVRGKALSYLSGLDPVAMKPIAIAASTDADPAWKHQGERALAIVSADPYERARLMLAQDFYPPMTNLDVVHNYAKFDSPSDVRRAIETYANDPDPAVRAAVKDELAKLARKER